MEKDNEHGAHIEPKGEQVTGLSICQLVADGDCIQSMGLGTCPIDLGIMKTCEECIHRQRFDRDDVTWLPEGKDVSDFPELDLPTCLREGND